MSDTNISSAIISPRIKPVSRIAVGSLTVSRMQSALPIDKGADVLAYAFDSGLNFIDTAQYYDNYDLLALALKKCKDPDSVVISTKTYAYSRDLAVVAVEEARQKLDRDVIDIFMLHEQESYDTLRGHMEALEYLFECRERGIIRAVGASTHHVALVDGLIRLKNEGLTPDVCHPLYNMAGIGIADGGEDDMARALETAHGMGIGIFAMKALGGGHLCASAEDALSFVLSKPFIDSVAVGMQSFEEVDANLRLLREGKFSDADKERLAGKKRRLHIEEYCEGCGACVERCSTGALSLRSVDEASDEHSAVGRDFVAEFLGEDVSAPSSKFRAVADDSKCVRCAYCTRVCPVFALKVY
ncbi:MAG: aldo/keto reductase [Clostridia bacterium]|nr:aldo/keto reductase [Clostridia bacterium]